MPHVLGLTTINTLDNIAVLKINLIGFRGPDNNQYISGSEVFTPIRRCAIDSA